MFSRKNGNQNNPSPVTSLRRRLVELRRKASILVPTVVTGAGIGLGVAALAIDTGLMYSSKQELRNAADAAALAGASRMGLPGYTTGTVAEAARIAARNSVTHESVDMLDSDAVVGHVTREGDKYLFHPGELPYDGLRVLLRRDQSVTDGPISLLFAKSMGFETASIRAQATAMISPRDIAVVVDLSSSMNSDSQLGHYKNHTQSNQTHTGVQIGLEDVWAKLPVDKGNNGVGNGIDPPPPGNPTNLNDQPGTGPGSPASKGGNANPGANPTGGQANQSGPRVGWMTGYGSSLTLGSYDPATDPGLYYIPQGTNTGDADVAENLSESGYKNAEISSLKNASNDDSYVNYRNRVKVMLGLAGWKSGKTQHKYSASGGDGDHVVNDNELVQATNYNFGGGSFDEYIDYVSSASSSMNVTDPNLRYRFGIKTFVNYLMDVRSGNNSVPDLRLAPEQPLSSVKGAVSGLVTRIIDYNFNDHVALVTYNKTAHLELGLTVPDEDTGLQTLLAEIPATLNNKQAGNYDRYSNMGGGLDAAVAELTGPRARAEAKKVIVLLTNGRPDVDESAEYAGADASSARSWAIDRAEYAKSQGITVYTVGVGDSVDASFLEDVASSTGFYLSARGVADPGNHGMPEYVADMNGILENLGTTNGPVTLID